VLNGQGQSVAVTKIIRLEEKRFCEIDAAFAHAEGQGDLSLYHWRRTHRAFFTREGVFDEKMMLLCKHFERVSAL
jgi:uncharacterized protein YhfF